jgi:hypothetical protein
VPKKVKSATRYKIRRKIPDPIYSLDEIVRPHVQKSPRRPRAKEQLVIAAVEVVAPTEAQPFLKWVGGKAQLLAQFDEFLPSKIDRYVEPLNPALYDEENILARNPKQPTQTKYETNKTKTLRLFMRGVWH